MPRLYFDVILIRKPDTTTTFCYGLFLCRTSSFTFLKYVFMNNFTFHHDLNGRKRKICKRTTYTAQNKLILGSFTKKKSYTLYFLQKEQKMVHSFYSTTPLLGIWTGRRDCPAHFRFLAKVYVSDHNNAEEVMKLFCQIGKVSQ